MKAGGAVVFVGLVGKGIGYFVFAVVLKNPVDFVKGAVGENLVDDVAFVALPVEMVDIYRPEDGLEGRWYLRHREYIIYLGREGR